MIQRFLDSLGIDLPAKRVGLHMAVWVPIGAVVALIFIWIISIFSLIR